MAGKAKKLEFTKMQAIGNDAIILDCLKGLPSNPSHLARKLCNRRLGIGADQLLLLSKSRQHDYGLKIFNADGSEAEVCGNGLRCVARYLREKKYTAKKEIALETLSGVHSITVTSKLIHVDMGEPHMKGKEIPVNLSGRVVNRPIRVDTKDFRITCLSIGNPHCVIFQENLESFPVDRFGPLLENHHIFPRRANISFVNILGKNTLHVRVWERGAGETLGCGSAACAVTVASVLNGFTDRSVTIQMPGGKLEVEWLQKDNHLWLKGPAEMVYSGEIQLL